MDGQVKQAESLQQQALFRYRQTVLTAFREVEDSLIRTTQGREELLAQQRQVDALARAVALSRIQYEGGTIDYLQVLDTERSLFSAEMKLTQTHVALLASLVSVYKAMGGGWFRDEPSAPVPSPGKARNWRKPLSSEARPITCLMRLSAFSASEGAEIDRMILPLPQGFNYEAGMALETWLNKKYPAPRKNISWKVLFIPVRRDQLLDGLITGKGDLAAGGLTVTAGRQKIIDFSVPMALNVREVVVTAPHAAPSEDLLEMVNAGLIEATVVDMYLAYIKSGPCSAMFL